VHLATSLISLVRLAARSLLLLLGTLAVCFLLFHVIPGDPARAILGINASPESVAVLREELGLNRPLTAQFTGNLAQLIGGDFGRSLTDHRPIRPLVAERFAISGMIGGMACLIALVISYLLTVVAFLTPALRWLPSMARSWVALPAFLSAVFLALTLGTFFPALPLSGYAIQSKGWTAAIFPACIVTLYPAATMLAILGERLRVAGTLPYWRAARATGTAPWHLLHRHGLAPAWELWLTVWINQISLIFFTTFLVEIVFSIPGVGGLLLQAIQRRDFSLLQGIVVFNALFFLTVQLAGDVIKIFAHRR
jgi:ABC-type dipeptide/oligopeptide/nickel transport system permease component